MTWDLTIFRSSYSAPCHQSWRRAAIRTPADAPQLRAGLRSPLAVDRYTHT